MFGNLHLMVLSKVMVKLVKKRVVVEPREIKNNAKNKKKKHSRVVTCEKKEEFNSTERERIKTVPLPQRMVLSVNGVFLVCVFQTLVFVFVRCICWL